MAIQHPVLLKKKAKKSKKRAKLNTENRGSVFQHETFYTSPAKKHNSIN